MSKTLAKKIALKQFLNFAENFKGETFKRLQELFLALGLDEFAFHIIKKEKWYKKTMAIYVISELKIENDELIRPFLKSNREELREQAIFYFIRTSKQNPLAFLEDLKEELNIWEQIFIEDSLLYFYKGETPDFAQWLKHPLKSVVLFAIRMIYRCNQFTNIPQLTPLLEHPDMDIRKSTIISLRKLSYENLLALIIPRFGKEAEEVQKETIKAIAAQGEILDLYKLRPYVQVCTPVIQVDYARVEKKMKQAS
ncbi:HEAT repeat domain-containing protein [Mesonia sp. K7]|uniref:HEAT repeat domain-containing protein n=1 Tax=Mesonia sp. K7 TaxID=2218606 RepID=UPI0011B431E0|nr:hypothetical protein [Mesonia sp. K7]